jgi:integrase
MDARVNQEMIAVASFADYEQLLELWHRASPKRRDSTTEHYWKVLQSFARFVDCKPLANISRKDVVEFRDHLLAAGQSAATATNKVSILKTLFNVGVAHELITANPATQVRTAKSDSKSRVAFTSADLSRIFNSKIYLDNYRPKVGGRDACYWLPLLALFTGARIEELAQLLVKDVHYVPELGHYLNITDEAEHAKLKNASSRRHVPVHPILVACGFIDYVQSVSPSKFLFPHLKPNPRGKMAGYFSNFFGIYLRKTVKITDRRKVFHSFRHTFKDVCRKVGIEEAVHDALTGHTGNSVSRKYGNEQYPLEPLFAGVAQYEINGLDLSHLIKKPIAAPKQHLRLIAAFYGVTTAFVATNSKKDSTPFIIALCDGAEAGINIANHRVLFGQLPAHKQLLVDAWISIHREELVASWNAGRLTGEYMKVEPLR